MISGARSRHSRRGLVAVAFELLLGGAQITATGTGAWFMIRGNMEWRAAQRELAAAGYSLEIQDLTRAAVPDAENFGATPALNGIAARPEEHSPEIKAKLKRLEEVLDPAPSSVRPTGLSKKPDISMSRPIDWKAWRAWLAGPRQWKVPKHEPDDAKAVAAALATQEPALVEELLRAARRPRAQFLPGESQRIAQSLRRGDLLPDLFNPGLATLLGPCRFFRLHVEAAHAAGQAELISQYLPVMISLAKMPRTESSMLGQMVATTLNKLLAFDAVEWIRASRVSAADLSLIQEALAGYDGTAALRQALHVELWFFTRVASGLMEKGGDFPTFSRDRKLNELETARSAAIARIIMPANTAVVARQFLKNAAFLKRDDWAGLLAEAERFKTVHDSRGWLLNYPTILADDNILGFAAIHRNFAEAEFHRRLAVAACALERWRLEGKDMPDTLEDLPERLLPEVPRDIDGKPIRYRPTPEGFVVWSVGLNLQDDWHGAPPPDEARDKEPRDQADWQVRVP